MNYRLVCKTCILLKTVNATLSALSRKRVFFLPKLRYNLTFYICVRGEHSRDRLPTRFILLFYLTLALQLILLHFNNLIIFPHNLNLVVSKLSIRKFFPEYTEDSELVRLN